MIFDKISLYKEGTITRIIDNIDYIIYYPTGKIKIKKFDEEIIIEKKDYEWFSIV